MEFQVLKFPSRGRKDVNLGTRTIPEMLRPNHTRHPAVAFTLVEILISLGIVIILAVIVSTAAVNLRKTAASAACVSNLRQIAVGFERYSQENEGKLPPHWGTDQHGLGVSWYGFLAPYCANWNGEPFAPMSKLFHCPGYPRPYKSSQNYLSLAENGEQSYGYNFEFLSSNPQWLDKSYRKLSMRKQAQLVIVGDIPALGSNDDAVLLPASLPPKVSLYPAIGVDQGAAPRGIATRHSGGANFLFLDGHVEHRISKTFLGIDYSADNWVPTPN